MTILVLSVMGWIALPTAAIAPASLLFLVQRIRGPASEAARDRQPTLRMRTTG